MVIVILCVVGFCVCYVLIKIWLAVWRVLLPHNNKYITKHRESLANDKSYQTYLNWCSKFNQIPIDKEVYLKDVEDKKAELRNLID